MHEGQQYRIREINLETDKKSMWISAELNRLQTRKTEKGSQRRRKNKQTKNISNKWINSIGIYCRSECVCVRIVSENILRSIYHFWLVIRYKFLFCILFEYFSLVSLLLLAAVVYKYYIYVNKLSVSIFIWFL